MSLCQWTWVSVYEVHLNTTDGCVCVCVPACVCVCVWYSETESRWQKQRLCKWHQIMVETLSIVFNHMTVDWDSEIYWPNRKSCHILHLMGPHHASKWKGMYEKTHLGILWFLTMSFNFFLYILSYLFFPSFYRLFSKICSEVDKHHLCNVKSFFLFMTQTISLRGCWFVAIWGWCVILLCVALVLPLTNLTCPPLQTKQKMKWSVSCLEYYIETTFGVEELWHLSRALCVCVCVCVCVCGVSCCLGPVYLCDFVC